MYSTATDKLAGNGVRLTRADGTYFFYGHMQRVADGIGIGVKVKAGQVLGYLGKTGGTTTPHLHLEVHPFGGEAIDPTPIVAAVDACSVTTPLPVPAP
jgi:murein DD-endopeptidase MepM/ murein hydrolase activator NlpD